MPSYRSVEHYCTILRIKAEDSGLATDPTEIIFKAESRTKGYVRASPLHLRNGSFLRFIEEIEIDNAGQIHRPSYAYHYQCADDDFWFRYDRDPDKAKPIVHEECHLHVTREDPRFKSPVTSFEEVFNFVVACFHAAE